MRTTLTIDDDLHARLEDYARTARTSFKDAVNVILRRGLSGEGPDTPFVIRPHPGSLAPGVDPARLNQLLDEWEAEDFVGESR